MNAPVVTMIFGYTPDPRGAGPSQFSAVGTTLEGCPPAAVVVTYNSSRGVSYVCDPPHLIPSCDAILFNDAVKHILTIKHDYFALVHFDKF